MCFSSISYAFFQLANGPLERGHVILIDPICSFLPKHTCNWNLVKTHLKAITGDRMKIDIATIYPNS